MRFLTSRPDLLINISLSLSRLLPFPGDGAARTATTAQQNALGHRLCVGVAVASQNRQQEAEEPIGAEEEEVRGMDDQTEECASWSLSSSQQQQQPDSNNNISQSSSWSSSLVRTRTRKELIVAPLATLIGLQSGRQAGGGGGLSAFAAASGVRGLGTTRRRLRSSRRDAQNEEEMEDIGGVGAAGGVERETIDLIQIPALKASTTSAAIATAITTTTAGAAAVPRSRYSMDTEEAVDVDHSCNRISETEAADRRLFLLQTTNNVALEEDTVRQQRQPSNNRTSSLANTPTMSGGGAADATRAEIITRDGAPAAEAVETSPINPVNNQLDSELAPSWSKIRISHCYSTMQPGLDNRQWPVKGISEEAEAEEELISNSVIKNGNHKYCYEMRTSATSTTTTATPRNTSTGLLTAAILLILANVNTVAVWADTSLGE